MVNPGIIALQIAMLFFVSTIILHIAIPVYVIAYYKTNKRLPFDLRTIINAINIIVFFSYAMTMFILLVPIGALVSVVILLFYSTMDTMQFTPPSVIGVMIALFITSPPLLYLAVWTNRLLLDTFSPYPKEVQTSINELIAKLDEQA